MPRGGARPGAGRKRKNEPKPAKTELQKLVSLAAEPISTVEAVSDDGLSPLGYLLQVVRDQSEDKRVRLQAASIAAPYLHARKGEGGKKEEQTEQARRVAERFGGARTPPKLVHSR